MKTGWFSMMVLCVLLSAGCKKKPTSVAQPALEQWLTMVAEKNKAGAQTLLAADTVDESTDPDPTVSDGVARHFIVNIGVMDWIKFSLEKEVQLPNGARELSLLTDLCLRPEDASSCSRPNKYRVQARMVNEGGAWKVSSAGYEATGLVR